VTPFFQAKTIEFDVNFLNFEDPEVFERFTGPDFEKYMKTTYGFDQAIQLEHTKLVGNVRTDILDETVLYKFCAESENR
jgi:hypothetical protein